MGQKAIKQIRRKRRRAGIRKRVMGTSQRPRLSVFRSLRHVYAQLVDDLQGVTMATASTVQSKISQGADIEAAKTVGRTLAEKAKTAGIEQVTFDRGGFKYHGRIKALADAARAGGLKF